MIRACVTLNFRRRGRPFHPPCRLSQRRRGGGYRIAHANVVAIIVCTIVCIIVCF